MNLLDEMKTNDKNYEKANTIYNIDFKWPKKIKKVIQNQGPTCLICKPQEKNESIVTEEYEKKIKDFQALFDRFPNLKDVLCKMNTNEIDNLVKEKHRTIYDSDYNKPNQHGYDINGTKENYDDCDDDGELDVKRDVRIRLKTPHVQRSSLKYSGISPPEPYVVPISEYRSTIHSLGTRIIKEQLMVPQKPHNLMKT